MGLQRFRITVEFDGSAFSGWQSQQNAPSVQQALEQALAPLHNEPIRVHGSGRTDAGVHATGQVAHFDAPAHRDAATYLRILNVRTPHSIAVLACQPVAESFHARYDAYYRQYLYRINTRKIPPALERSRVWHYPYLLDAERLAEASALLLGTHDFSSFRAAGCQSKSPVKFMRLIQWQQRGDEWQVSIGANAFLQHMVRNLVGTLVLVGKGDWPVARVAELLAARDRVQAGPTAPAWGLYLTHICYPGDQGEPCPPITPKI
ncbi:tRNA pseudouridine(38-40) synthase TruA [Magnetococcus marinus]|uniref:tRNA pseudouridine(38-40) synthase TruA n=1 Tax=Magnetococcus marinus TaxID=1124597 RepID=UPI001D129B5D|nr:tRNA pseudouridine(38-40) synthase TruA [Magnetococcus marinus]